jgi:virginiamycin B lyase
MFAFLGGIMITSGVVIGIPNIMPKEPLEEITITGTPLDNYPDVQRTQFCESSDTPKSTPYIIEYKIPTKCTQPVAITTDPVGNVWFAQTNTGKVAKFDPKTESFTEYENPKWPKGVRSMMWGMDYAPDNSIWYTDESTDAIWRFSIDDQKYERTDFPKILDSLPQRLSVEGSIIIVNDFTGNKLTLLDPSKSSEGLAYFNIPSPVEGSVTGAFTTDSEKNVWYTNWVFQRGGVLAKFNQEKLTETTKIEKLGEQELFDFVDIFQFPPGMNAPNGIAADSKGNIWIADTSSSLFFKFEPEQESFTKYITSHPPLSSYGNSSGLIKAPVSRPYWITFENGKLVFNEQTANRIAIFDPDSENLVEYLIPSKNPKWADCEGIEDCGLAQIFDFEVTGDRIWFTEWVENNIGVIDTSKPLPFTIHLDKQNISLNKGQETQIALTLIPIAQNNNVDISIISATTSPFSDLIIKHDIPSFFLLESDVPHTFQITIKASEHAIPDIHKVLIGAQTEFVSISQYVTVIIEQ